MGDPYLRGVEAEWTLFWSIGVQPGLWGACCAVKEPDAEDTNREKERKTFLPGAWTESLFLHRTGEWLLPMYTLQFTRGGKGLLL